MIIQIFHFKSIPNLQIFFCSLANLSKHGPTLLLRGEGEDPTDEDAVGHNLQPGVGKAGRLRGTQDVQHVAVGRQYLENIKILQKSV